MDSSLAFSGRVAVVSGGLGDIGAAIARQLHEAGARVGISDCLSSTDAHHRRQQLELPETILYHHCDVTSFQDVDAWLSDVEARLGTPDVIIPCAATATFVRALQLSPAEWEKEISVGLHGAYYMASCAARRMVAVNKPGHITFVGSWAGHAPHVDLPAYSVAKAGVRMLAQCLALELARQDILVNEVAPGYVDAGLSGKVFQKHPDVRTSATRTVPLQRLICAEDVAQQVLYLSARTNRHMTGSTLLMDGGLSLRGPADGNL